MVAVKTTGNRFLIYGLPLLVTLTSIGIAISPLLQRHPELAMGITYDLTLTAPVLFLLLSRKSPVSKLKAIPFFIGGIVIASFLLPENGQEHLNLIKTYLLPVVEVTLLTVIVRKIYKTIVAYRANSTQTTDFYAISKKAAAEVFGTTKYAAFFASEITMLYYAFFAWKKQQLKSNEFTNYKENASIALAGAFLMVVCIETYAFHVLLLKWNFYAAWFLTATSTYTAFMIISHIKALLKRPSILTNTELIIKNGLIADMTIELNEIEKVEAYTKEMASKELNIGNLGLSKESTNHNTALYFKTPQTIEKAYGFTQKCDVLLLHIDNKNKFVDCVNAAIKS